MTLNTQSINKKAEAVIHEATENDCNICVITETWINDENMSVLASLNSNGYKFLLYSRQRRGGGIGLLYKESLCVKIMKRGSKRSFEFALWKINHHRHTFHLLGIYHPPHSSENKASNSVFIEEFGEFLSSALSDITDIIITGDMNIHVNDDGDKDAREYLINYTLNIWIRTAHLCVHP